MKKLIATLFAASLAISMIACGSSSDAVKVDPAPAAPAAEAAAEETPAAEEAPKKSLKKDEGNRMERPTDDE